MQRLLRAQIHVIADGKLVIAGEFGDWEDSKRGIDLLGVDKNENLVVIELKRTVDGGHMELQTIRYVAMVSTMTFEHAGSVFAQYLTKIGDDRNARETLLEHLEWDEPQEQDFGKDVRIVLASAESSKELATAVMWLNERMLDIKCFRLKPCLLDEREILDAQQLIPNPEVADYQIRQRNKAQSERRDEYEQWNEKSFLEELRRTSGIETETAAKELLAWIAPRASYVWCG